MIRNGAISIVAQIGIAILQLVNRKLFVLFLDIDYLGFQSVFGNIFIMLSAVELGISEVIIYQLYKELAQNNQDGIRNLMTIYKRFYLFVAIFVSVFGGLLYFALPYIVTNTTADWQTVYAIYFINLLGTALTYILSYRRIILMADQKQYVCESIDLVTKLATVFVQLLMLALLHNFVLYVLAGTLSTAFGNLLISRRVGTQYPYLNHPAPFSRQELKKRNIFFDIKNYAVHKIAGVVYYGTDNIIIATFCGIRTAALYSSYYLIQSQVQQMLIAKLTQPVRAAVGNLINSDNDLGRHWTIFKMLDFSMLCASMLIGTCYLVLFQPFIQLWLGDVFLLPTPFVILLVFTLSVGYSCEALFFFRSAMGNFNVDRNEMVISAIINVTGSIILVKKFGIAGIQLGTLLGLIPILTGRSRLVIKQYFGESMLRYWGIKAFNILIATGILVVAYQATLWIPITLLGLGLKTIVGLAITTLLIMLVYHRTKPYRDMLQYLRKIVGIIINKIRKP